VRAGNAAGDIAAHCHGQTPAKGDIRESAMDDLAGRSFAEQNHHGNYPIAKENQDQGAEEFGHQLGTKGILLHEIGFYH
jgi:hypothetical protein